jgi:hypothetical protein
MKKLVEKTLNYDANTIEEALEYIDYRNKQLLKFGYSVQVTLIREDYIVIHYKHHKDTEENFGVIYLLKDSRGKGRYLELIEKHNIHVVTLSECNIGQYLKGKEISFTEHFHGNAYLYIQQYYGSDVAERSQVPYIYHIDEGGGILEHIGASRLVKDAYYLHPFYQADEAFQMNLTKHVPSSSGAIALAMEYRHVANSYLSKDKPSNFIGFSCPEVKQMLIADKVQNYKDFLLYHKGVHRRSDELDEYFNNWFEILEIKYENISNIIT